MIRIALVDDHQLFRDGLASLLSTIPDMEIAGKFANGREFLTHYPDPDVVLLDINMPEMDGFGTIEQLAAKHNRVKIILISMLNDYSTIDKGLKLRINGFLPKDADKTELELAVRSVYEGRDYFHSEITSTLIRGHQSPHIEQPVKLTPRELDILKLIVKEYTTQQIADALFVSTNTVETHRKNLLSKTGVTNSVGLVKFALSNNLCD